MVRISPIEMMFDELCCSVAACNASLRAPVFMMSRTGRGKTNVVATFVPESRSGHGQGQHSAAST